MRGAYGAFLVMRTEDGVGHPTAYGVSVSALTAARRAAAAGVPEAGWMADVTADFFDDLSKRGQEPLLGKMRATVRFDIADG